MGERESAPPVGQIPEIGGRAGIIIKLGEGRNTALYQKFKDRMDNILSISADNWDAMSIPNLWTKPTDGGLARQSRHYAAILGRSGAETE